MVTAIYPGTFDPITNGHSDIVERAAQVFDKVLFAVSDNTSKLTLFSLQERVDLAKTVLIGLSNVVVVPFSGLVTDFARKKNADVIIRGIRVHSDLDYELQMAGMNHRLRPETETLFFTPRNSLGFIASSLVQEISAYGGDVSYFVHEKVASALKMKRD